MADGVGKWAWSSCPWGIAWDAVGGHGTRVVGHGRNGEVGIASLGPVWGWEGGIGHGCELTRALTYLLKLQPHFVEGSKPIGLGPRHGVLTLLAFFIFLQPETEARCTLSLH